MNTSIEEEYTWDLLPQSSNPNVLGCRWIFKTKLHADGSIERHKAHVVAKGFSQIHRLDFEDSFSLVVLLLLSGLYCLPQSLLDGHYIN